MPASRRKGASSPPPAIGQPAISPQELRASAVADERTRLDHALRSGARVIVTLPRAVAEGYGGPKGVSTYRLVGVRDNLVCELIDAAMPADWGRVDLALPCSADGDFWKSALEAAGLERHRFFA